MHINVTSIEFWEISLPRVYRKNSDSYDTIPYGPLCIEAVTCRRPPRARTEIALQADVLCGLSTCRCSPCFSRDPASFSEPPSSREETPRARDSRDCDNGKRKSSRNRNTVSFFTSRERRGRNKIEGWPIFLNFYAIRNVLFRGKYHDIKRLSKTDQISQIRLGQQKD